jgi:hypothetical protein
MRTLLLALLVACSFAGGPAHACLVGGSVVLFTEKPSPPSGSRYSTIAKVELRSTAASPADVAEEGRGYFVASAQVLSTIRGPRLPQKLPTYLEAVTTCTIRSPNGVRTSGYVVGRLKVDKRGPFLLLASRKDPQGIWP